MWEAAFGQRAIIFELNQAVILAANSDSERATEHRPELQVNMVEIKSVTESQLNILPNSTNAFYTNSKVDANKVMT
jgi:hypothetical protein